MPTAKELREERAQQAKVIRELADKIAAEKRDFTPEEKDRWEKADAEYNALTARIKIAERADEIQAEQSAPAGGTIGRGPIVPPKSQSAEASEHQKGLAIQAWLICNSSRGDEVGLTEQHREACAAAGLNPQSKELRIRLYDDDRFSVMQQAWSEGDRAGAAHRARRSAMDFRAALGTGLASAGGAITAPESMTGSLEINMLAYGGMLQAADILTTTTRDRMRWPTANDTGNKGRRLGESKSVTSVDPTFGAVYWDLYKYTSDEILVPFELLTGQPINLPTVLGPMLGERIGRKLSDDLTTGTGSNQPKGAVTAAATVNASSATVLKWDDFAAMIDSIDPAYRPGSAFMFHDTTRGKIRDMKDGQGRPLWLDGPNGTEPQLLRGYPWMINQSMDSTIASGKKTVMFGRMSNYKVRRFAEIRIYRLVERHREDDQDAFLAFAEYDGNLLTAGTAPLKVLTH